MPYVDRINGKITGIYEAEQYAGQEFVDAEVELYKSPAFEALEKISALEMQQTPRLVREAALGEPEAVMKLQEIEDKISVLRGDLNA